MGKSFLCISYLHYQKRVYTKETVNSVVNEGYLLSVAVTIIFIKCYTHEQSFMSAGNVRNTVLSVAFLILETSHRRKASWVQWKWESFFGSGSLGCHQSHPGEWPHACSDLGSVFLVSVTSTSMMEFMVQKCNLSDVSRRNVWTVAIPFIVVREFTMSKFL